jgi:hypothetical protein
MIVPNNNSCPNYVYPWQIHGTVRMVEKDVFPKYILLDLNAKTIQEILCRDSDK